MLCKTFAEWWGSDEAPKVVTVRMGYDAGGDYCEAVNLCDGKRIRFDSPVAAGMAMERRGLRGTGAHLAGSPSTGSRRRDRRHGR